MSLQRRISEIVTIFAVGAIMSVSSILWIGSGIENENSQIAAAFLGLVGLGIGGMSLVAVIVIILCPKLIKETKCQEHEDP